MLGNRWADHFEVTEDDIDFIVNTLLEKETPMTTEELTRLLIDKRLEGKRSAFAEQFEDTRVYNPEEAYDIGERLVFTEMELATATVTGIREGHNPEYGTFDVLEVEFDNDELNSTEADKRLREFAAKLGAPHKLSEVDQTDLGSGTVDATVDDVLYSAGSDMLYTVRDALLETPMLTRLAGQWFPSELVIEADIGTLHLAEAVLDMNGGGPMSTEEIIEQIGGFGSGSLALQVFSLNMALNDDDRFDEVGPAGHVAWYLKRMEPEFVQSKPKILVYKPINYDESLLDDDMYDLETELDDELTPIEFEGKLPKATSVLLYPHRRLGTLPLNAKNRTIFPTARTPRIYVELVDTIDDEVYNGWVVHEHGYVYGLWDYYTKHSLPIGAYITIEPGERADQILVSHEDYNARTEWVRLLAPVNGQIKFENKKRPIGADYDDLMLIGTDDLKAVDELQKIYAEKELATILREIVAELSNLSPQGTVHAVTLYSAVNAVRRCPPGPVFATLVSHPDFEDVGNHYWKLQQV